MHSSTLQKNIAYTEKGESSYHLLIFLNCEFVIYLHNPFMLNYIFGDALQVATFLSSIHKSDLYFMHDLS